MTVHCAGLTCDKTVERAGQFCSSCWPGVWRCIAGCDRIVPKQDDICGSCETSIPELRERQKQDALFMRGNVWEPESTRPSLSIPKISAPKPPTPETESEQQIRMKVWHQAYKLALGTKAERASALEQIAHLVNVLQHSQHNPEKET